jgi:hypothetical protein
MRTYGSVRDAIYVDNGETFTQLISGFQVAFNYQHIFFSFHLTT